jgi:hypothetical protein
LFFLIVFPWADVTEKDGQWPLPSQSGQFTSNDPKKALGEVDRMRIFIHHGWDVTPNVVD